MATTDDLPHRTSISRALTTVYNDCKAWLVDHIKITCPSTVAVTFDGWSDKYRRRSYITLTLHYVNKNFDLLNLTLSTSHISERHKANLVLSFIESLLDCYAGFDYSFVLVTLAFYLIRDRVSNEIHTLNI